MIETATGNLLTAPAQALVNTVNTQGVMGKGIALQFAKAYPHMLNAYEAACKANQLGLGKMHVYDLGGLAGGPRWIINFPTKGHWRANSKLQDIAAGLADLVHTIERLGIESIAIPPLGCGNGGLNWSQVRPLIVEALDALPHVRVLLFEPAGAPASSAMPNATPKPAMTPGQAMLLLLMHRYLKGLLDPFISLLEVHKLMYFMQEAGQNLRLNYKAEKYGPYAVNLGQVIKRMEGHYLQGFGNGHSDPKTPLELLPHAAEEAVAYLASNDDVMKRIDRVTKVIEGFEDSYGMEMLSTMLWVMVHHPEARQSCSAAIGHVHAWNERKRLLLKPQHLEKAWERLKSQEWDFSAHSIVH